MGCNPTAAALPWWYAGTKYPEWPRILSWFTVYREAGSRVSVNTRVAVRNLSLWIKSKKTGQWTQRDLAVVPGFSYYPENMAGTAKNGEGRIEADGSLSVKPSIDYCAHGWGVIQDIDVADVGGLYVGMEARVVTDDTTKPDTRLTDRWVFNCGADYYPPKGSGGSGFGSHSGRYIKACTDWRIASGAIGQ